MKRPDRLSHELRDRIGELLRDLLEISSGTVVTVTRVAVTGGGEHATVSVSVLPWLARAAVRAAIDDVAAELQRRLHRTLGRRRGPRLRFALDEAPPALDRLERPSRTLQH